MSAATTVKTPEDESLLSIDLHKPKKPQPYSLTLVRRTHEMTRLKPGYVAQPYGDALHIYKKEKKSTEQYRQELQEYHEQMKIYREKLPHHSERWRVVNRFVKAFGNYNEFEYA